MSCKSGSKVTLSLDSIVTAAYVVTLRGVTPKPQVIDISGYMQILGGRGHTHWELGDYLAIH